MTSDNDHHAAIQRSTRTPSTSTRVPRPVSLTPRLGCRRETAHYGRNRHSVLVTLAEFFVTSRPLTLNLDIDIIRGLLSNWTDHPTEAGLLARQIAGATALDGGHDVIMPQFIARPDLPHQLGALAASVGARYVEAVLDGDEGGHARLVRVAVGRAIYVGPSRRSAPRGSARWARRTRGPCMTVSCGSLRLDPGTHHQGASWRRQLLPAGPRSRHRLGIRTARL